MKPVSNSSTSGAKKNEVAVRVGSWQGLQSNNDTVHLPDRPLGAFPSPLKRSELRGGGLPTHPRSPRPFSPLHSVWNHSSEYAVGLGSHPSPPPFQKAM